MLAHLFHCHFVVVVGGLIGDEHGHLCLHMGLILIVLLHGLDGVSFATKFTLSGKENK